MTALGVGFIVAPMPTTVLKSMKGLLRPALWALLIAATLSPAAHAAWSWPRSDSAAKARQTGKTVHPVVQHAVRPLGSHLRVVKPLGGTRPPPKTILAKRPP
jgi:hypothetical protein